MSPRTILYALLGVVALAAAILSFAALRDLALVCGFWPSLSWLLPVVVDAGAAAGSLAWLGRACGPAALRFGRALALVLLASSVAGNAVVHGLAAYGQRPHWSLVVAVSAVAPAVLGAVVHLAVLVGRAAQPAAAAPELGAEQSVTVLTDEPAGNMPADIPAPTTRRPGAGTPPPAPVGPTTKPAKPRKHAKTDPKRTAANERARRSRAHSRGDHTLCLPGGACPDARIVRLA